MIRQRYRPEMSEFMELIEDMCYWQDRIPPNIQDRVLDEYLATGHLPEGPPPSNMARGRYTPGQSIEK